MKDAQNIHDLLQKVNMHMVRTTQSLSARTARLAAKSNPQTGGWLPLWVHSLDTALVAERLLTEWLSEKAREAVAGGLDSGMLQKTVCAAAILHDLGKATALFQTRITKDTLLREKTEAEGFQLLSKVTVDALQSRNYLHAAAGETLLLMAGCPFSFAEVIGAHHGKPWTDGGELQYELRNAKDWRDPRAVALWGDRNQRDSWQSAQREMLLWMLSCMELASVLSMPEVNQTSAMLLTGLIIMADWISSNEKYFPLLPADRSDPGDMHARLEKGWQAISLPKGWKPLEINDLGNLSRIQFGFDPNPVQKIMMETVRDCSQPGLMILEAPMGMGKTEAALLAADVLSGKGAGGIFFGLPTQATANAIFSRVAQWGESQPEGNRISIRLAHGMAEMNEKYQALMAGTENAAVEEDGQQEKLLVHEWFNGRKQALLADFVVGTVDQVLIAALRQKHLMLRHLGLCGKTVIIDECHAYDAYMNQYLEAALRWLGRYHTPVIMLSATLPKERRAAFIAAYLNKSPRAAGRLRNEAWYQAVDYPALTWTDGDCVYHRELPNDSAERNVELITVRHGEDAEEQAEVVASVLEEALKAGGCAAVILNTVKRAQIFARILKRVLSGCTILLLHSRFVISDRLEKETELLRRMGKHSTASERDKFIVVGTQVIEQSLDYDADIMISDLCPADLLMQRLGRLHRHPGQHDGIRPGNLKKPVCYLLCAGEKSEAGARMVYGEYLLIRTRSLLPGSISLPSDIPRIVNQVYDETVPLPEVPDGYDEACIQDKVKRARLEKDAKAFCIHNPDDDFSNLLTGDIPSDDDHARAQVRAGEMTMDVLLLMRTAEGDLSLLPWLGDRKTWPEACCPSAEDSRRILSQKISISNSLLKVLRKWMDWDELQQKLAVPKAWEDSNWLRGSRVLPLDENLSLKLGGIIIRYSRNAGLEWEKEETE